jgi:hypothetical protein
MLPTYSAAASPPRGCTPDVGVSRRVRGAQHQLKDRPEPLFLGLLSTARSLARYMASPSLDRAGLLAGLSALLAHRCIRRDVLIPDVLGDERLTRGGRRRWALQYSDVAALASPRASSQIKPPC